MGLLLTLPFENLASTVSAVCTVLLSAGAVLCGLRLAGIELDISALMRLTTVIGMVTELIIFLLRADLDPYASALALGISRGAGLQQPLTPVIIFDLVAAVPLVLFFLPAMVEGLRNLRRRSPSSARH